MLLITEDLRDRLVLILHAGKQALDNVYLSEEVAACDKLIVELESLESQTVLHRPARLDAEGTAEPLTRLVGHAPVGACIGPGIIKPDAIEDRKTGQRTPLK